jgi:hypothetical protein
MRGRSSPALVVECHTMLLNRPFSSHPMKPLEHGRRSFPAVPPFRAWENRMSLDPSQYF